VILSLQINLYFIDKTDVEKVAEKEEEYISKLWSVYENLSSRSLF
jgi:hypothetical protein